MDNQRTPKKKRMVKSLIIILIVVLVISGFMGGCMYCSAKDNGSPNGTLSMIGNVLRRTLFEDVVKYQTFSEEALYPVEDFRMSLTAMSFETRNSADGMTFTDFVYTDGQTTATNMKELQQIYNTYGATEMYTRVATKRQSLETSKAICGIAKELDMPINIELGCFYTYSDAFSSQYPDFADYPEITVPKHSSGKTKEWKDMNLDEMCDVLKQYGKVAAQEILSTGCEVSFWDIGNETNYGFAGVMLPLDSAVTKATSNQFWITYLKPGLGADWLAENVWKYNAKMFAAVQEGVKSVDADAKFSSHISTVTCGEDFVVKYFQTLKDNGYSVDQAGISYYPNSSIAILDQISQIKSIILAINQKLGVNVMIAEFGYCTENSMGRGGYENWNNKVHGYELNDEDQSRFFRELVCWGRNNGLAGIRPWACEHRWLMSWFNFDYDTGIATAKPILTDMSQYIE